jgi:hypothetical protein
MNYYQLTFETLTLRENLIAKINSLQITTKEASKRVQDFIQSRVPLYEMWRVPSHLWEF